MRLKVNLSICNSSAYTFFIINIGDPILARKKRKKNIEMKINKALTNSIKEKKREIHLKYHKCASLQSYCYETVQNYLTEINKTPFL